MDGCRRMRVGCRLTSALLRFPLASLLGRAALASAVALLPAPGWGSPQGRAGAIETASRATVFLRIVGDIDLVSSDEPPIGAKFHRPNVEIATGSGFLISPLGQVLTCSHVVADGERTGLIDGRKAKVAVKVTRIEVFAPSATDGAPPERYEASIVAVNADLDVAVLSISGNVFPAAELGDSDALEAGDGLDALGFPFGRDVEIGRPVSAAPVAPDVSVSHGDFSAFRGDEQGTRRFLQTTAAVNPGNSGGPVIDGDGYVVGIVSRRLSGSGAAIGFAVPINLVKDYLESNGLDGQLPARRLSLAGPQTLDGKGLRLRLPWGYADASPFRARVDTGAAGASSAVPTLRIDRLLTPLDVLRLADALSAGQAFEAFAPSGPSRQRVRTIGGRRVVAGRVTGTAADGAGVRVEYAVVDLGQEKVVARYAGSPALMAYNASVFRGSLASLESDPLRRPSVANAPVAAWVPISAAASASPPGRAVVPAGWVHEPQGPLPCRGIAPASDTTAASPLADFARTLRVGLVRQPGLTVSAAAAACGTPGADGAGDYQAVGSWLGANVFVEGRFVQVADAEFLRFEVVGPAEDRAVLRELFNAWMSRMQAAER